MIDLERTLKVLVNVYKEAGDVHRERLALAMLVSVQVNGTESAAEPQEEH